MPFRVLYFISDFCFLVVWFFIGYRKKVVYNNLKNSFPGLNNQEIKSISKKFYRHFLDLFIETIKLSHLPEKEIRKRVKYKNIQLLEDYYRQGKSVITIFGHYCNWEWHAGFPLHSSHKTIALYKPLKDKRFDSWLLKLRRRFGAELVPTMRIMHALFHYHGQGILFNCAFLADQSPQLKNTHHWINFLNQQTIVLLSAEKIARRFNIPVVYMKMQKLKRGYYTCEVVNLTSDPSCVEEFGITQMFFNKLEEQIREQPELWLWSHRRWRHNKESWEQGLKS